MTAFPHTPTRSPNTPHLPMASLRKKSGRYYARFYDRNRSPKRKELALQTTRKDVARRRLHDMERRYEKGDFDPWDPTSGSPENLSLEEAKEQFIEARSHLREATVTEYRSLVEQFIRRQPPGLALRDVEGSKHLLPFVRDDSSVSVATLRKRWRHIKAFLNWNVEQGHLDESPLDGIRPPKAEKKTPEFLTPEQLERWIRAVDADFEIKHGDGHAADGQITWIKDAALLAVGTGIRRRALVNLQWRDVNFDSGFLTVRNNEETGFKTKSGHARRVPIVADAKDVLHRLHDRAAEKQEGQPTGYVLRNRSGGQLSADYTSRRFKHYVRVAKLPEEISFHSLRHTCASWLAMKGVSMKTIQAILGHSTTAVTEKYAHLAPAAMKDAMEKAFAPAERG